MSSKQLPASANARRFHGSSGPPSTVRRPTLMCCCANAVTESTTTQTAQRTASATHQLLVPRDLARNRSLHQPNCTRVYVCVAGVRTVVTQSPSRRSSLALTTWPALLQFAATQRPPNQNVTCTAGPFLSLSFFQITHKPPHSAFYFHKKLLAMRHPSRAMSAEVTKGHEEELH